MTDETTLHQLCKSIRAYDANGLPGDVERAEDDNARMLFTLDDRREWRFFPTTTEAYKAKAGYRGIWRPSSVQCWNVKEQIWM
jgi:hypothetical protein